MNYKIFENLILLLAGLWVLVCLVFGTSWWVSLLVIGGALGLTYLEKANK